MQNQRQGYTRQHECAISVHDCLVQSSSNIHQPLSTWLEKFSRDQTGDLGGHASLSQMPCHRGASILMLAEGCVPLHHLAARPKSLGHNSRQSKASPGTGGCWCRPQNWLLPHSGEEMEKHYSSWVLIKAHIVRAGHLVSFFVLSAGGILWHWDVT